jgi:hypothetical protein
LAEKLIESDSSYLRFPNTPVRFNGTSMKLNGAKLNRAALSNGRKSSGKTGTSLRNTPSSVFDPPKMSPSKRPDSEKREQPPVGVLQVVPYGSGFLEISRSPAETPFALTKFAPTTTWNGPSVPLPQLS